MSNNLFSCIPCLIAFHTRSEQATHLKTNLHTYNLRRRANGQQPFTPAEFAERQELIEQFMNEQSQSNGSHKDEKSRLPRKRDRHIHKKIRSVCATQLMESNNNVPPTLTSNEGEHTDEPTVIATPEIPITYTAVMSLFDGHIAASFDENCQYMQEHYSLYFPDANYISDKEAFVTYLGRKICEGHQCLYCNKPFPSRKAVLQHMSDCGHRRIGTHLPEHQTEYEDFYDYSSSYKELNIPAESLTELRKAIEAGQSQDTSDTKADDEDEWEILSEYECVDADAKDAPGFALVSDGKSIEQLNASTDVALDDYMRKLGLEVVRLTEKNNLVLPLCKRQVFNRRNLLHHGKLAVLADGSKRSYIKSKVALKDTAEKDKETEESRIIKRKLKSQRTKIAWRDMTLGIKANRLGRYIARKNKIFI